MKKTYINPSFFKGWKNAAAMLALFAAASVGTAVAQEGSQGNTTIFGGAQMTFFGNQSFLAGGGPPQLGIIGTERTSASGYGVLNFNTAALTVTGANDGNHVDGYVRNLGAGLFVYPVGDNGFYGPFAATGAGTTGAYYHVDASSAITSNLAGGNYPVLPSNGPFDITKKASTVGAVSNVEYWDIDGTAASKITLTWDAGSNVSTLTGSALSKLIIVGWDVAASQWVKIASTVDVTSVLGGASALAAGSITTNAAIVPNTYSVYTLAAAVPDLTPTTDIDGLNFVAGGSRDFVVNLYEINNVAATGTITFRVNKLSGFTITYPTVSGTSNVFGGSPVENSNWSFTENGAFITVTAKAGITIPANGQAAIGFHVAVNAATPILTAQNITATIIGGSGGEVKVDNNNVVTTISRN